MSFLSQVLESLKTKLSDFNYNHWFRQAQWTCNEEQKVIQVFVPNKFVRDWIIENYLQLIKFESFKATGTEYDIVFSVSADLPKIEEEKKEEVLPLQNPQNLVKKDLPVRSIKYPPGINPRYNFDNFVVGSSNQFVHAACKAVAQQPGRNYNPLFIYGGVGLGKTHLLNSIAIEMLKTQPNAKIIMVSGETFTNEVINAIRYDKTVDLRNKYRSQCDLLLIDDIQFIAGKERTMEEFFHTFNALYEGRKQIVLTSDTLPKDIPNLEERLRSRFSWGLLADIQVPDFETRCAILRKKADDENIQISNEVTHFIGTHIKSNVRDLEGSLVRISAFASLSMVPITIPLVKEVLKDIIAGFSAYLTIDTIQNKVAHFYGLSIDDLKSPRRHKSLALPRQVAMFLCKKHLKSSFPEIGNKFGGKDHTTVIHACGKINQHLMTDTRLKAQVDEIEKIMSVS